MNYDIISHQWWPEVQEAIGIHANQLPELVEPGTDVGPLLADTARQLGLTTDTHVINGGMDQSAGAIGAGNFKAGVVSESTGAALAIQATISEPLIDQYQAISVYCHSAPGMYLFVPVCPTAGMALKWLRDTFFQDEITQARKKKINVFDALTRLAQSVPAGSDGLVMLPHLMGSFSPEPNLLARGSFTGFSLSHNRAHFVRALLEGVAYMLRRNLEYIERTGLEINEIRSTGGGARSILWNHIKADVCHRPVVTLANEDTAMIGDSILAGVACGIFASIDDGCQSMVKIKERIMPGAESELYQRSYAQYCSLDGQLSDYFKQNYSNNP